MLHNLFIAFKYYIGVGLFVSLCVPYEHLEPGKERIKGFVTNVLFWPLVLILELHR